MTESAPSRWSRGRAEMWVRQALIGPWLKKATPLLLAAAWLWRRLLFRTTFIAITGSVGKTTAKELLAAILEQHGRTYKTIANQNGPKFVALNILRVRPWHRYAVLEVATSQPGVMARSAPVVRPDLTLVLAMRRTHAQGFRTIQEHAAEKEILVRATRPRGTVALFEDDPLIAPMADGGPWRVLRYGVSSSAGLRARNVSAVWPERLSFEIEDAGRTIAVHTQLVGEHWLPTVLGAFAAAQALGLPLEAAARAVATVPPFPARLQPVSLPNGAVFLRDDYNGSSDVYEAAFDVLRNARADRRILVMTDMSDSSAKPRDRLKRAASRIAELAEMLVFIGDHFDTALRRAVAAGLPEASVRGFFSLEHAAAFLRCELREGDLVLLKGRATDHVSRIFFAQFAEVACWKAHCPKTMLCDECWELGVPPSALRPISLVPPPRS